MTLSLRLFRAVLIALLTLLASAQPTDPYSIKQDALGESLSLYQQHNSECLSFELDKARGTQFCKTKNGAGLTYAGAPLQSKNAGFMRGRLYLITLTFLHDEYAGLKSALSEKFGRPSSERSVDRSTLITIAQVMKHREMNYEERRNVPLESENASWKNGVSTIELAEYDPTDPDFRTSLIIFSFDELQKEAQENLERYLKEANTKAKSDM